MPVQVTGATQIESLSGAARVEPVAGLRTVELRAEGLVIEHAWQRGVDSKAPAARGRYVVEQNEYAVELSAAAVRFSEFEGQPLFVPVLGGSGAALTVSSGHGATVSARDDVNLVGIGPRPDAVRVANGPHLSFWHTMEGPALVVQANGFVRVDGNFTLFVHNVTIDAGGNGASWSDWTGYHEGQPDQPVTDYELRVTMLHVTNGTLAMPQNDAVTLATDALTAQIDGVLAFPSVSGRLMYHGEALLFDNEPLTLTGTGGLSWQATHDPGGQPALVTTTPPAGFDPLGFAAPAPGPPGGPGLAIALWPFVGGTFLLLTTAGLTELGILPGPTPALQRRRHARWMRRGRAAAVRERWALAAWCYEKAVRARRNDALAWYEWSYAELEAGHWAAADDVARRAADVPGIDALDLLEVRASAAWEAGDAASFTEHLSALAKDSRAMARGLVDDLGIDVAVLEARLRKTLEAPGAEDILDGYA